MPLSPRRLFGKVKSRGACRQGPVGEVLKAHESILFANQTRLDPVAVGVGGVGPDGA